jgi:hypothetical protein
MIDGMEFLHPEISEDLYCFQLSNIDKGQKISTYYVHAAGLGILMEPKSKFKLWKKKIHPNPTEKGRKTFPECLQNNNCLY